MPKDTRDMTASEINRELDRLSAADSKLTVKFIEAGRGNETPSEYLKLSDPLSLKARAIFDRRTQLKSEIRLRTGSDYSRMPTRRRQNPTRSKTVDVFLPMTRARAEAWLRARRIPFTHMRDMFQGVAFRIRRGYVLDFKHEKDKSAPGYNPGFSAKEERQYRDIVRSGRKRYGTRAREIAARTVLKGRRRNPARAKYETTLNGVQVRFFQGYAEDVRYTRAQDGQPYSHVVETDAAELYLCEHPTYGRCLLIVDPSGTTPLWG